MLATLEALGDAALGAQTAQFSCKKSFRTPGRPCRRSPGLPVVKLELAAIDPADGLFTNFE